MLRRQNRGGFVEDQKLQILHQTSDDLDPLTLAHRQGMNKGIGIHLKVIGGPQFLDAGGDFLARARDGHGDVFHHCQGFEQRKMLENHADPKTPGRRGVAQIDRFRLPRKTSPSSAWMTP